MTSFHSLPAEQVSLDNQGALCPPNRARHRTSLRQWTHPPNTLPGQGTSTPRSLTTVVQLGMSLTEFFTSSSVTSTTLQCSSSEGRGSSPCLVTQGCNCGGQREGGVKTVSRQDTQLAKDSRHLTSNDLRGFKAPNPTCIHSNADLSRKGKLRPVFHVSAQPSPRPPISRP
jgi:hypothetical protein